MDALRASLPAGTLSGAPKIRAMQIIDELEPVKRGPYGGAVGYLSYTGELDTCIYIRSALVKDGARARAGRRRDRRRLRRRLRGARDRGQGRRGVRRRSSWRASRGTGRDARARRSTTTTRSPTTSSSTWASWAPSSRWCATTLRRRRCSSARPTAWSCRRGPARPAEAGVSVEAIRRFAEAGTPVLGVCLGHQALAAGVRRPGGARRARARQDRRGRARRQDDLRGPRIAARGRALPLAGRRPDAARLRSRLRPLGRRDHGPAPPRAAGRGRAVPPGVGAHADGQGAAAQLPRMPNPILDTRRSTGWRRRRGPVRRRGRRACCARSWRGSASEAQTAAFLIALRTKGETVEEIAGLARTMRELAVPRGRRATTWSTPPGTGGGRPTFNVSTTAALRRRRRGLPGGQARQPLGHQPVRLGRRARGARARASTSSPSAVADCIDEVGFGFMFAPHHHPAMRHVVPVRKELGGAHDLQLPRPADQPGRRARAR